MSPDYLLNAKENAGSPCPTTPKQCAGITTLTYSWMTSEMQCAGYGGYGWPTSDINCLFCVGQGR